MYIKVSLYLGCYSAGRVELSLEGCAVDLVIVTLTVLLPYMKGNSRLAAISHQRPRGWAEFEQHLDSAQEELLNDMSILHSFAAKMYS